MACPAIGALVADTLDGSIEERLKRTMRWRPEISENRDLWDSQGRYGAEGKVMDLRLVQEWTTIGTC
jgi:sarcosine oxidase/L-pipecolate oxidase